MFIYGGRKMIARRVIVILLVLTLVSACSPKVAPTTEGVTTQATTQATKKLKFVYVSPDSLGIDMFLVMGKTGIEALRDKYNAEIKIMEGATGDPTSNEQNVRAAIAWGADVIVLITWKFNDIITKVAAEYPNQQFLIIDSCFTNAPANVHCAEYKEYEASYIIGAIAGKLTKTNKVGVIGALDIPFLHRYTDPFLAGAKAVNPNVETERLWIGGDQPFSDPAKSKELALMLASKGYDQIFTAAAGSDYGVFEAVQKGGFQAYGVDINHCLEFPGHIVENLTKRVDLAMIDSVDKILTGKTTSTSIAYGIEGKYLGLVYFTSDDPKNSKCLLNDFPEVISLATELRDKILSGKLVIKDPQLNP